MRSSSQVVIALFSTPVDAKMPRRVPAIPIDPVADQAQDQRAEKTNFFMRREKIGRGHLACPLGINIALPDVSIQERRPGWV